MQQYSAFLAAFIFFCFALGCEPHSHGAPDPGAHVHGVVQMDVAVEGKADAPRVDVELRSPAVNLYGFEHEARTEQETQARNAALTDLAKPEQLLDFGGAECLRESADVHDSGAAEDQDDHDHHNEHEHDHEHEAGHLDVHAVYAFSCDRVPTTVTLRLHGRFPGIETVYVRVLSDSGEKSANVRADGAGIDL